VLLTHTQTHNTLSDDDHTSDALAGFVDRSTRKTAQVEQTQQEENGW